MTTYWCELAWLGGPTAEPGIVLTTGNGAIESVDTGVTAPPAGAVELTGLTLPSLANVHSHAFHRALRGHTHGGPGSFWTWRDQMYDVAQRLDPDRYHRLARATFAEMVQAGIGVVGEFHYIHHQPDGEPYPDPNAMGEAVTAAAREAGIRLTLLDTCYLHGGLEADGYRPVEPGQLRFSDGSASSWAERVDHLEDTRTRRIGAAVHSVRAVDPASIETVAGWAEDRRAPVHVHLSEQPAENEQCLVAHGTTPAELLDRTGLLGPRLTAVHATHLTGNDVMRLGSVGAGCCFCPTTERDLADGIGPSRRLAEAGARLSVGSDSNAVIDLFEEARALELDCRLDSLQRGNHAPGDLLTAVTDTGYRCLGWGDGGRLRAGGLADFTTVDLGSVRMAGVTAGSVVAHTVFAATASDVTNVVVDGEVVVRDGRHVTVDVAAELVSSIAELVAS